MHTNIKLLVCALFQSNLKMYKQGLGGGLLVCYPLLACGPESSLNLCKIRRDLKMQPCTSE